MTGKTIMVTGANRGIGRALAAEALARGASRVYAGTRQPLARPDDRVTPLRLDVTSTAQIEAAASHSVDVTRGVDLTRLVDRAVAAYGRLDVLVSNAGISKIGPVADLDMDGWSAMIDVNLRGVLHGIAAALPVFRRQGHGHLVTTVSTAGLKIVPSQAVYAATKNAVRTLLEGLRQESTDGVPRTTAISPGFGDITIRPAVQG